MDYKKISEEIVQYVGGKENIKGVTHCVTRLRLILNDTEKYDRKKLENVEGSKGVVFNSGQLMIIFGTGTVNNVYDAFVEVTGAKEMTTAEAKQEGVNKLGKLQQGFKVFSDIFIPIIPAFVAAAIIIGLKALLTAEGLFGLDGALVDHSTFLSSLADFMGIIATTFDYLPILVMYSAVKRFGGNPILGILVGIVMIHPSLMNRNTFVLDPSGAEYWNFAGLQIAKVAFQGGVFPAVLTAWFMSKVEKIAQKHVPAVISFVLVPTITVFLANIALFTVFGPIGNLIGTALAAAIDILYNSFGAVGAFVFAALLQPLVVTGTHQAIQGIEANLIATTGFNYIQAIWSVSIIAQGGGAIGMYLLAKKKSRDRDIAMSSFVPTLVGISEPAIFAVNLKYSVKPFVCACLGAGFAGAFMKLTSVRAIGQGLTGVLGLLIVVPEKLVFYIIGNLIAFVLPIVFIVGYDKIKGMPKGEEDEETEIEEKAEESNESKNVESSKNEEKTAVHAVVDGKVIPIEQIGDGVFSAKILGDGVGIMPESETIVSPADGTVCTLMEDSKHAVGVTMKDGRNILIHVGIDTVSMNGDGFSYFVKMGDTVKAGDKLLSFDKKKIEKKGLNPVVVVVEVDGGQKEPVKFISGMKVRAGKDLIGE
ncbi:MAG: glucose PTS transporter subunit IIA [bacterium]|nr:glucose PTS transporter subunit IIA [bacterium]